MSRCSFVHTKARQHAVLSAPTCKLCLFSLLEVKNWLYVSMNLLFYRSVLIDFSLTVKAATLIFISGRASAISSAKPSFHWTAIPLRSWRSRIFSKMIPNRHGSVDSHTIWGLEASSTLPVRFYYASVTLRLQSHFDHNEDLATLSLHWWRCSCDLAMTLATELRFRCAFVSFLYIIWTSDTLLLRQGRFYCASTALWPFLLRFVSFWLKFRIVAESPSNGKGGG